jgi:hypothetical protein
MEEQKHNVTNIDPERLHRVPRNTLKRVLDCFREGGICCADVLSVLPNK